MDRKRILWITRTALLLALTVLTQMVFRAIIIGPVQAFIIGAIVNLLLITTTVNDGFWSGFVLAVFTPVIAFFQNFLPPFPQMILAVALGNLAIVSVYVIGKLLWKNEWKASLTQLSLLTVTGAIVKSAVLYFGVVKIVLPTFILTSKLPAEKLLGLKTALSFNFSWPQLVTALIGGILFILIYPTVKMAIGNGNR